MQTTALTATVAAAGFAFFAGLSWAASRLDPIYSGASLAAQLPADLRASTAFYSVRTYDQSLTFYLRRPVTIVEWSNELNFGLSLEPEKGIPRLADFEPRWRAEAQALALMEPDTYSVLAKAGLPMVVRARAPKELIVSRR